MAMTLYQITEMLCRIHNKNQFERVLHPVRKDNMMLYSVIYDLTQTYHWNEFRVSEWIKRDLTRCTGAYIAPRKA
jgi:hypothetical protein